VLKRVRSAALLCSFVMAPSVLAAATTYDVDKAHSSVGFSIRHLLTQVQGKFNDYTGAITYDPAAPDASVVELTVQAKSIDTGNERRDGHLKSPDFFDATKFPTLSFKSQKIVSRSKDELDVTGVVSMHGVSRTITVPVKVLGVMSTVAFGQRAGFQTTFALNRKEFGINWNKALDTGGMLLGDDVTITINVEAAARQPAKP
jgi:polyisoprenoid-binding protein YceI